MASEITQYSPNAGVRIQSTEPDGFHIDFHHQRGGTEPLASFWIGRMYDHPNPKQIERVLTFEEVIALRDATAQWLAEQAPGGKHTAIAALVEAL